MAHGVAYSACGCSRLGAAGPARERGREVKGDSAGAGRAGQGYMAGDVV